MNDVRRFALYFDESGHFCETSLDSPERSDQKWPSQLMGLVVPLEGNLDRDADAVLRAAHNAAGLKLPPVVHASDDPDRNYGKGKEFDLLISALLKECPRRQWQPVRCSNAEQVSFGKPRDNYLCLVGLLVCRTIESLDRDPRYRGKRVELRVIPARRTDRQPDDLTRSADIGIEEYEREIRRMLGILLGLDRGGQRRIEVDKPENAKISRLLQICDLLSSASKNDFDKLGETAKEEFRRRLRRHDWPVSRFRPDNWLQEQDRLLPDDSDFIGREQIFQELDGLLQQQSSGVVLIQGQPGRGKTALLARLLRRPEQLPRMQVEAPPAPIGFFFRRTAGQTNVDMAVRHLYAALLRRHSIWEPPGEFRESHGEQLVREFARLLQSRIARHVSPANPQLLLIDALDEADDIKAACAFIPCPLPDGVFVIATVRPGMVPEVFAARCDRVTLDLESLNLRDFHRHDILQFVERETLGVNLEPETRKELARVCAGNFLVAREVCRHLKSGLRTDEIKGFLEKLVKAKGPDQLGTVYSEFWKRLDAKRAEGPALFAAAATDLTQEIVCGTLGWRFGEWDEMRTVLRQYLTETNRIESTTRPDDSEIPVYRLYHESFAEWIRGRMGPDVQEMHCRLANFCKDWSKLAVGEYSREYALGSLIHHLVAAKRLDDAIQVLSDLRFIQARAEMGTLAQLLSDYAKVRRELPEGQEEAEWERERDEEMDRWTAAIKEYSREWAQRRRDYTRDPTANEALKYEDVPLPDPPSTAPVIQRMRKMESRYGALNEKSGDSRLARLRAFEHFVALNLRDLSRFPKYTPMLARNFAAEGPVAEQGEGLCQELEAPWLAQIERAAEVPQPPFASPIMEATEDEGWILSRNGRIALVGEFHGRVLRKPQAYDIKTGQELPPLPHDSIHQLTPDGSLALSTLSAKRDRKAGEDAVHCRLAVISLRDGKVVRQARLDKGEILAADFTPDSSIVAALRDDGAVLVWDGEDVAQIGSVPVTPDASTGLWLSLCGRWLWGFVASEESEHKDIWIWDVWSRAPVVGDVSTDSACAALEAKLAYLADDHTADGRLKALLDEDRVYVREQQEDGTSAVIRTLHNCDLGQVEEACRISADGRVGISYRDGISFYELGDIGLGKIVVLDLVHGRASPRPLTPPTRQDDAVPSPDGVCEIRFESADTVSLWHKESGQCLREMPTGSDSIAVKFSVDGSLLITTPNEGFWAERLLNKMIRDIKSGGATDADDEESAERSTVWEVYTGDRHEFLDTSVLGLSPDGAIYVHHEESMGVWNPVVRDWEDATKLPEYPPLRDFPCDYEFTADGRSLWSPGHIISCRTGAEVKIKEILGGDWYVLQPLPDGQHFVVAKPFKRELILWDQTNRTVVATMPLPEFSEVDSVTIPGIAYRNAGSNAAPVELRNRRIIPRVTAIRRFRVDLPAELLNSTSNHSKPLFSGCDLPGTWEEELTYLCPACRTYRIVPQGVWQAIQGIADSAGLLPDHLPTLVLPDEDWDEPALKSQCDACGQQLRFNPFVFGRARHPH